MNKEKKSLPAVKQQISVAFEQELQDLLTPRSVLLAKEQEKKDNLNQYNNIPIVGDGMLIW